VAAIIAALAVVISTGMTLRSKYRASRQDLSVQMTTAQFTGWDNLHKALSSEIGVLRRDNQELRVLLAESEEKRGELARTNEGLVRSQDHLKWRIEQLESRKPST
jgi:hypothetical protein